MSKQILADLTFLQRRRILTVLVHLHKRGCLSKNESEFLDDLNARFVKYGPETWVSPAQLGLVNRLFKAFNLT